MIETGHKVESGQKLLARLADARARTDDLFDTVMMEALYDRPIPERHRIIFYIGHLEAFDRNLLADHALGDLQSVNPAFDKLFAFGIDPVDGGLPDDQPGDWPRVNEVQHYRHKIRQLVDNQLEKSVGDPESQLADGLLLNVMIEHRLMHAETLTYMLHALPFDRKLAPPLLPIPDSPVTAHATIEIPPGHATLGLPPETEQFGWDNELSAHKVAVPGFRIETFKVTNHQFLKFIRTGGYGEKGLWSQGDWNWIKEKNIQHPLYWSQRGDQWYYRTAFSEVRLPPEWPVYVSHAEAAAYARWAGKRLPTEAEFHRAAYGTLNHEREYPWGTAAPDMVHGNFDFHRWDSMPVEAHPAGRSAFGVDDLLGNGWEWTATVFEAFPGFEPFAFYPGYSANFFDGKHYVMKGGSARTAACMLRRSFRNWFQPHYQYVYAGFRCVSEA
jgi:ergothioneine biosynthesis protein EgtB